MWTYEKKAVSNGFLRVAGVDEAGRGPLAGPVVAAAVVLPSGFEVGEITDSKKLTPKKRDRLYDYIRAEATAVGVGIVDAETIDTVNILQASLAAMREAVMDLGDAPDFLLVDGKFEVPMPLAQEALVKGDSRSASIASASIVAKVIRDRMMAEYAETYPEYGFAGHKGYPTKAHKEAIATFGPTPIHRKTFRGVAEHVA
ncbi:ribonuclease HII [Desulfoluna butyratoxydans]|uniref:Ribonuclease HII n=1 Tax=Desulfoluna butyratoxydans TaxID=231438 RepID=A0A4U8YUY0_9BACT|nr:ribonuclease HII [Desulfoluna butyratoxydans]VFQ45732.1 ribonuclease hii/hiii domain [Desulfoluna butyratoxydans]